VELCAEAVWHRGDVSRPGKKPAATSGFNLCLGDDDDDRLAFTRARAALNAHRVVLAGLSTVGARACCDVGVFVGEAFSRNVFFSTADLQLLIACGVELEVSAYPTA
jgi:hypothetical protein